ncbi:tetratricopeptide repeat protein [Kaarinaea lacus]
MIKFKNYLTVFFLIFATVFPQLAGASIELGLSAYNQRDYELALKELKPFADKGDEKAMYVLAEMYFGGLGTTVNKPLADELYLAAANKGHIRAQYKIGLRYLYGAGQFEKDYKKAANWLTRAAGAGDESAQFDLAIMYLNGEGVDKDFKAATGWLQKAAYKGHVIARYEYGRNLALGRGVDRNIITGTAWMLVSLVQGNSRAADTVEKIRLTLTSDQIKQVQNMATDIVLLDMKQRNSTSHPDYKAAQALATTFKLRSGSLKIGETPPLTISFYSPKLSNLQHLVSPDKKTYAIKASGSEGFNLSIFSEKENEKITTNESCRQKYWIKEKDPFKDRLTKETILSFKHLEIVLREYSPLQIKGRNSNTYHGNAYFFKNGRCIDVHASQVIKDRSSRAVVATMLSTVLYQ